MDELSQTNLVSDIKTALRQLDYDVTVRNEYMNTRDRALYGDGLFHDLEIEDWFAEYNYCHRVVDIHSAQLMGRGFSVYSYYDKSDIPDALTIQDPQQLQITQNKTEVENKLKKANADARKKAVDAIIRDNGGLDPFKRGARQGSAYGNTAYKAWFDVKSKKYVYNLIESIHNYRRGWDDTNFRSSDFDSYVYQISVDKANRLYGDKLPQGASFDYSQEGEPFMDAFGGGDTGDPLNQNQTDIRPKETTRPMVTVIDFTGYRSGWCGKDGKISKCEPGKETKFNVLVVGGHVVQAITDEKLIPRYYFIPNRVEPRRAWGRSDLPQSALDINKEIIQLMADQRTWADKNLFKLIMAKGFTASSIPKKKARKSQVVAMSQEQDLAEMQTNPQSLQEWERLVSQRMDAFVRLTGVGHVLFDDPSVNTSSNQALLTTLKGVIDIVEDKQSRWEPVLVEMFTDALKISAEFIPEMKPFVLEDSEWYLNVEWPSVLRREDATYQTMWLNLFNAGVISIDTYHQKIGIPDSTEELERIKDNMKDYVAASIMGHNFAQIATLAVNKEFNIDPAKMNLPKITIRGDASPAEVGNLLAKAGADEGPYAPATGPQGIDGMIANDTVTNAGSIANPSPNDPQPIYTRPNPQQTTDNNTGAAPTSQPGSGATAVTPAGAVAQANQNAGR